MAAQSQPSGAREPISRAAPTAPPSAACDLCGIGMAVPQHCVEQGQILGLLVCSACIEDQLEARCHGH